MNTRVASSMYRFVAPMKSVSNLAILLLLALVWVVPPAVSAQGEAPQAQGGTVGSSAEPADAHAAESHDEGWMPTVAKVFNFLALVGILIYFLRSPITAHLAARHATIRRELVDAQTLRQSADQQLASVRTRLAELPGELEALQARGMDELAHERARLQATTVAERAKLLERTRRDIDLRFRVARRDLVEHTADLAVRIARSRIEQEITADDHTRLVDRYAQEVRS